MESLRQLSTPVTGASRSRARFGNLAMRTALLSFVASIVPSCVDDQGQFTPGKSADASIAVDGGVDGTGQDASATEGGTPDAGAVDASLTDTGSVGGGVDSGSESGTVDSDPSDTGITKDIKADMDSNPPTPDTGTDSGSPSPTPDAKTDVVKTDVKQYKPAPADQTLSEYVPGMELPVQQVLVVTKGKVYKAFQAFGHKWGVTPWENDFLKTVNGADVYTLKMADLPQDTAVAGKGNFRVVVVDLPEGTNAGTYIDSITGKMAQDGKTPIFDRAPLLPVHCPGEYSGEDAKLLAEAITKTGKMEFNHNLEMLRDTLLALLQENINIAFANAGKSYAPQCTVQAVTPGDVKIVDGQVCTIGCLVAYISGQPIVKWTQQIQQK